MTRSAKHKPTKSLPAKAAAPTATVARACAADDEIGQQHDAPLLVLHVVRILALYLYVLLAHQPHHDATSLNELFFPETKAMERLVESTATSIEQQVHAALLACVQGEIASNQFDGLIQEKTVFAALQRIFRQQKVHVKSQCRLLVRLLNSYLAQLTHAPIVRCESMGMLASTLEYLAHGGATQTKNETVAASLLYPLVNAIDSLSIEQRECLDALTTLWRWLDTCELSKTLLDRIVRLHHSVIFSLEPTNAKAVAANHSDDLGACFVRTLVRHADHIFRHDLDFTNPHDLLCSDSDFEDDASSSSRLLPPAPSTPPPKKTAAAPLISPSKLETKNKPLAKPDLRASIKATEDPILIDAHEPMPANMMRVGIAAAAGTLAAALCVIFT